jgi:hypothetical protein
VIVVCVTKKDGESNFLAIGCIAAGCKMIPYDFITESDDACTSVKNNEMFAGVNFYAGSVATEVNCVGARHCMASAYAAEFYCESIAGVCHGRPSH